MDNVITISSFVVVIIGFLIMNRAVEGLFRGRFWNR